MSSETISLFLNKALQRILKDSSRRHTQLRESIKVALDAIQGSHLSPEESPEWDRIANKLVIPLKHACETRQSKIMGTALDCLQKLMAYGLIRGTAIDEEKPDKRLIENVIETVGACFDFPDDNVQLQIIKAFLTAVTSPICDIHDNCLMNAIRSVYNIYLVTKNQVNITTAKATLTQMLNIIFQRMEIAKNASQPNSPSVPARSNNNNNNNTEANGAFVTPTDITEEGNPPEDSTVGKDLGSSSGSVVNSPNLSSKHGSTSVHFNDCFLIFRALCKLSMKDVPEGAGPDAMDMKSKVLSLELIQMILESSGPAFRHSDRFVNSAIKKYLCASLLNNGVSPVPRVFKLSLSIFLALMSHFRENLKAEIGVFFSKIFLWILENNNSTIQQKWMVLQVLYQICKNPQTLVDIFVNYDCDPEAKDIFERMVYDLSRIAQGGNTVSGDHFSAPAAQELKVKTLGLECLVTIMKSLVDWSKELYEQNEKENTETSDAASTAAVTSKDDLDALEQMRKQKQFKLVIETGKQKFNISPRKGVEYLIQGEVLQNDANNIASFLKTTEGLDRTKIGEYLGDSDPFIVSVLYAYVDLFSFQKMAIDDALREFLSYFRLPSDGHKIDRMLEKFAERYTNDNPSSPTFANADAVYTLAFAIVVLLTDLHSPTVQTKMTKQDWFKMNKGCNGSGDFDYNLLYVIYDNCAHEPLRLRGEKDGYGTTITLSDSGSELAPMTFPAPPPPHEDNYIRSLAHQITNVLMFWSTYARFHTTHANHDKN